MDAAKRTYLQHLHQKKRPTGKEVDRIIPAALEFAGVSLLEFFAEFVRYRQNPSA